MLHVVQQALRVASRRWASWQRTGCVKGRKAGRTFCTARHTMPCRRQLHHVQKRASQKGRRQLHHVLSGQRLTTKPTAKQNCAISPKAARHNARPKAGGKPNVHHRPEAVREKDAHSCREFALDGEGTIEKSKANASALAVEEDTRCGRGTDRQDTEEIAAIAMASMTVVDTMLPAMFAITVSLVSLISSESDPCWLGKPCKTKASRPSKSRSGWPLANTIAIWLGSTVEAQCLPSSSE